MLFDSEQEFPGADVRFGDVQDPASIKAVAFKEQVDVVVSCLASRTGGWGSSDCRFALSIPKLRLHASWRPTKTNC